MLPYGTLNSLEFTAQPHPIVQHSLSTKGEHHILKHAILMNEHIKGLLLATCPTKAYFLYLNCAYTHTHTCKPYTL